ncbi:MAG: CD225/dispanin family protein [Fermentimonas sp.]|jgi:hypothetical protein
MNRYFYIDSNGKQKGTYAPEELRGEGIRRDTLVWREGLEQWKRAEDIEELRFLFDGSYTVQPTPVNFQYNQAENLPAKPKNWLLEAILVTLLPFVLCGSFLSLIGIVAIVYASQVDSYYNRGDYNQANDSASNAKRWVRITFWILIGWIILIVIALIVLFLVFGFTLSGFSGVDGLIDTIYHAVSLTVNYII